MIKQCLNFLSFNEMTWEVAALLSAVVVVSYLFTKVIMARALKKILFHRNKNWKEIFTKQKSFEPLAYVLPLFLLHVGLAHIPSIPLFIHSFLKAAMAFSVALLTRRLIMSFHAGYQLTDMAKRRPITGYVQLILLLLYVVAGIVITCALLDKSPLAFLSGLGAITALLMLVFRDTILSFIAGIQIAGNNLLEKGDWIELNSLGANGEVLDIALNVVKIQNFDKSMVVLPTYKLLDIGFKSWRTMENYGRRRVKRGFNVDQTSIKELSETQIADIKKDKGVMEYLPKDCKETNNMGLFRAYAAGYLAKHSKVFQDYTPIIRFLAPTEVGLPIEFIFFILDTRWRIFEEIQADIMQHLTARLHSFNLEVGQDIS